METASSVGEQLRSCWPSTGLAPLRQLIPAIGIASSNGTVNWLVHASVRAVGGRKAYLSFDIDCLDPAFAPGTGTPVCGGPTSQRAERILCALTALDIVGADIVEVSPPYDHAEITALAAATVGLNILGLWAHAKGG